MSDTEILQIKCSSCNRTDYVYSILHSTQDRWGVVALNGWCQGHFSRGEGGVKRLGREAGHSPPPSANVKN
jgi:hypothetical protein